MAKLDLVLAVWPGLAVALLLGLALCATARPAGTGGWLLRLVLFALVVAGAGVCWFASPPGRPGIWLESAVWHGAAYLVGCAISSGLARLRPAPQPA
jgi:hypothetical protein